MKVWLVVATWCDDVTIKSIWDSEAGAQADLDSLWGNRDHWIQYLDVVEREVNVPGRQFGEPDVSPDVGAAAS